MWRRLTQVAALFSVALGYPSFYLSYKGCIEPTVGMTLMGRPLTLSDGSFSISPNGRLQAGVATVLTITAPSDGQFLLYISGATGSIITPWTAAGTCPQLAWTTSASNRATATITPGASGTLTIRALWGPTYGPVVMANLTVSLGGESGGCTDMTQSNGSPWYDSGGSGYSCSQYYTQTGRCSADGGNYQNFGMTANTACCVCGGGSRGRTCSDLTLRSGLAWYDSGGPNYNCQYYSQSGKCTGEGNSYPNDGLTANQACCTCGGGSTSGGRGSLAPTQAPTASPTVAGRCTDLTLRTGATWYDSGGPNYNCAYYQQNSKCATEGTQYANDGLTARQACCACGGGSNGRGSSAPTTVSPTASPTPAPTTTSGCTDIPFPNGQAWYDNGGTGYTCAQHYKTTSVCQSDGSQYANQGLTGNQACCTCGGGTRGTTCWVGTSVVNLCPSGATCQATGTSTTTPSLGTCSRGTDYTGTPCWIGYNVPATASCPSGYTCNPLYPTYNPNQVMPGTCATTSSTVGTQPLGGVCVIGGPYASSPIYNCQSGLSCITSTQSLPYQPAVGTCQTSTSPPTPPPTTTPLPCWPGYTVCPNGQTCVNGYCITPTGTGQAGAVCYLGFGAPQICATGLTCILSNPLTGTGTCQSSTTGSSGGLGVDCSTTLTCSTAGLSCLVQNPVAGSVPYATRTCQFTGTGQTCSTNTDCGANLACVPTGTYNPTATCQPTTSVTTGGCKDTVLPGTTSTPWHDAYGVAYTCAYQYTKPGRCASDGNSFAFQGLTANMACCVCGGGVRS